MKTKAKLTLAISTLSAVVLAAGVTSTFAWFTTRNEAKLTTGTLTVDTLSSIKLTVEDIGKTPGNINTDPSDNVTDERQQRSLGLVSSANAQNFYAPQTVTDGSAGIGDLAEVTSSWNYSNGYVGYFKYLVTVTADPETTTHKLGLYFTPTITEKGTATVLTNHYRVGVYESDVDGDILTEEPRSPLAIYSNASATYDAYASATATTSVTTTALPTSDQSPVCISKVKNAQQAVVDGDFTKTNATATKYFVVSLWVEGNNGATNDNISGASINLVSHFILF